MNRKDFLTKLGLGVLASAVVPAIIPINGSDLFREKAEDFARSYDNQWKEDKVEHFTDEELRDEYCYTGG